MARIKKQTLKKRSDGRYACRYKSRWFYGQTPEEALALREQFKEDERRGIVQYFVRDYAFSWLERSYPNPNPKTYDSIRRHVRKLAEEIGGLPVSDVKPSDIKGIYSARYAGVSHEYIKQAKTVFAGVFDAAVADGLIRSNPVRDKTAKPHKGSVGGHRAITDEERQLILTNCHNHRMFPAVMAMLYAGLRPQEAKALDVGRDVDFDRETVTVRQTAHTDPQNSQKYAISDRGKTERSNRTLPLLPPLKTALKGQTGLLITTADGKPVTKAAWSNAWRSYRNEMERAINGCQRRWYGKTKEHKALIDAGSLPPWVSFTVTPYDLRHSFATMCRSMHPPIELHTVVKWMGHADATMILQIYDSVTDDREETEAARLRESLTTVLTTKP